MGKAWDEPKEACRNCLRMNDNNSNVTIKQNWVSNDSLKYQSQLQVLDGVCHRGQTKPHTTYVFTGTFFKWKLTYEINHMGSCRYLHVQCMEQVAEDK